MLLLKHKKPNLLLLAPCCTVLLLLAYQLMVFGRLGPRGHRVVVLVVLGSKSGLVTVLAHSIMEATV